MQASELVYDRQGYVTLGRDDSATKYHVFPAKVFNEDDGGHIVDYLARDYYLPCHHNVEWTDRPAKDMIRLHDPNWNDDYSKYDWMQVD